MTTTDHPTAATPTTSVLAGVKDLLRDTEAPLRASLDQITAQLATLDEQRAELIEARRRIESTLRTLDPDRVLPGTKPGPKPKTAVERRFAIENVSSSEKAQRVARYLDEHADELSNGFTASELDRRLKSNGGSPPMSSEYVRLVLRDLHDRGVVRLDRKTKGGGKAFKIVDKEQP